MSSLQQLSIFWDEAAIYLLVYGVYALLVCALIFFIERKPAKAAGTALSRLIAHHALLAVFAVALFASSLLVSGWYAILPGGEIGAFAASLTVTLLGLGFFRVYSIERLALGYRSPRLAGIVSAVVLAAPYALGTLFIMLLASGIRN